MPHPAVERGNHVSRRRSPGEHVPFDRPPPEYAHRRLNPAERARHASYRGARVPTSVGPPPVDRDAEVDERGLGETLGPLRAVVPDPGELGEEPSGGGGARATPPRTGGHGTGTAPGDLKPPDSIAPGPLMPIRVPTEARSESVFPAPLKGRVEVHRFPSRVLEGNPWDDPIERDLPVYVPPSGVTEGRPLLLLLSGYTGAGWMHFLRPRYLTDSIVGRLDRLIRTGDASEAVLVAPDCLTTLGGSQYLNSTASGRYEDYVMTEVLPWVHERYRTGPTAVLGTSSGGYGAMVLALRHPDALRALGSNAGDAYFEYSYLPEFPRAFREIRAAGGPEALLRQLLSAPVSAFGPANPKVQALEHMGYASAYSPIESEPGRFDLPFDLETGELRTEVWSRWLAWDPVRMVRTERYRDALRRLAYVYADGGTRDEYGLDIGARIFAAEARRQGIKVDFQEFDGVHSDGGPRYDVMIPRLLAALGHPAPGARRASV